MAGISAWPKDDKIDHLEARTSVLLDAELTAGDNATSVVEILGPDGSPYEKGVFYLDIEIPERSVLLLQHTEQWRIGR